MRHAKPSRLGSRRNDRLLDLHGPAVLVVAAVTAAMRTVRRRLLYEGGENHAQGYYYPRRAAFWRLWQAWNGWPA